MSGYNTSHETIFNIGFWLIIDSDIKRAKGISVNTDQLTGLISALIDRGVDTPIKMRRWMRDNGLRDSVKLIDEILKRNQGSNESKYIWRLNERNRYILNFDFAPYRYDIAKRVADICASKDALLYR